MKLRLTIYAGPAQDLLPGLEIADAIKEARENHMEDMEECPDPHQAALLACLRAKKSFGQANTLAVQYTNLVAKALQSRNRLERPV